jgi:hypothetical protein
VTAKKTAKKKSTKKAAKKKTPKTHQAQPSTATNTPIRHSKRLDFQEEAKRTIFPPSLLPLRLCCLFQSVFLFSTVVGALKIMCWNVNGLRSAVKKGFLEVPSLSPLTPISVHPACCFSEFVRCRA